MASKTARSERIAIPLGTSTLNATIWLPEQEHVGVIIIHPATATPERFYSSFAEYATSRGLAAVTYAYRGTGTALDARKYSHLRMRDWMNDEVPAVARATRERFPTLPISAVGHSIGGHAMLLGNGIDDVHRFALVSSHLAATKQIAVPAERARVAAVLNILGPSLSRTLGYMPGKRLGLGEDMPSAAMIEWGRWARKPGYFFDDPTMQAAERAASVTANVLAVGASDDLWASPRQVDALTSRLTSANVERRTYTPTQLGAKRLGHHGLLRRSVGEVFWPELVDWLTAANEPHQPARE